MISLSDIYLALAKKKPKLLPPESLSHAAVALVLRETDSGLQVLFIERARHEGDPWSGNLAFPGGRIDETDPEPRMAAERETWEEVGFDLTGAQYLGRLDDITGAHLPVLVSCFVYKVNEDGPFTLNHEVSDLFWFSLDELLNPARHHEARIHWHGRIRRVPAIDLLGSGRPVLWGITYRMVRQFFDVLSCDMPQPF